MLVLCKCGMMHTLVKAALMHRLSGFYDNLNMIAIIGTGDQPCWLAEACKTSLPFFPSSAAAASFLQQQLQQLVMLLLPACMHITPTPCFLPTHTRALKGEGMTLEQGSGTGRGIPALSMQHLDKMGEGSLAD